VGEKKRGLHVRRSQWLMIVAAIVSSLSSSLLTYVHANAVIVFFLTAIALSLLAALALAVLLNAFIIYDGESTRLEGIALMGLYGVLAVSFWWG
jgi:uncharacterized membrane protein